MNKTRDKKSAGRIVLTLNGGKKTFTCSFGGRTIEIAAPSGGQPHKGVWTPEGLLVASVEGAVKESFMDLARKNGLVFFSYKSRAQGIAKGPEGDLAFSEIRIMPEITVSSSAQGVKAAELIKIAAKKCGMAKLLTAKISACPVIKLRK
jgi:organic hydroperoxide reductase OsmC/OhrA